MIFEEAIEDQDVINMMHKSGNAFISSISKDLLENCKMIGVWNACRKYTEDKNTKFLSWVYSCVKFECLHCLQREKPKLKTQQIPKYWDGIYHDDRFLIEFKDNLTEEEYDLVKLRAVDKLTLKEIGNMNNYSYEQARRKIDKVFGKIKNTYDQR